MTDGTERMNEIARKIDSLVDDIRASKRNYFLLIQCLLCVVAVICLTCGIHLDMPVLLFLIFLLLWLARVWVDY
jgi:Flp pilus assembly protein TadB